MDNQMFPGGSFVVDDGPQGCSLCGLLFNNSISLQHHMQFHLLSANPQLMPVNQPPDLGLGLNAAAANLLDLIACASSANSSLVSGQPMFTSVPSHLLSANLGLVSTPLQPLSLSQPVSKMTEKSKAAHSKASAVQLGGDTLSTSSHAIRTASTVASRVSQSSFMPSYHKDFSKSEAAVMTSKPVTTMAGKADRQIFSQSLAQFDQIEEALALPSYSKPSSFERQMSGSMTTSQSSGVKDSTKLFQPFSTNDDSLAYNITKSSAMFPADHLLSPVKSGITDKLDLDILTTPQKISYHGSNESLSASPKTSVSSEFRKSVGKAAVTSVAEALPMKSLFYPGLMDPLNVSPKATTQPFRDTSDLSTISTHLASPSTSPQSSASVDLFPAQAAVLAPAMLSPKISLGLTGVADTGKLFNNTVDDVATVVTGAVTQVQPSPFMNSSGIISQPLAVPDINQISNGTGYFNALTQKLINPGLSLSTDFAKLNPAAGSSFGNDNQKGKSYFENGVLISHDYDKISDTNDEDDLDRLIDGIDTKDTHIDKGYSEIDDLLNEFNENHPEDISKHKSQMDDFLLNDVLTDTSRLKPEIKPETAITDDLINRNRSAISELIEKENEVIDKESKLLESARLKSLIDVPKTSATDIEDVIAPVNVVTNSMVETPVVLAETKPTERKDEDPADFEIPKVGKLMKIRKYFESQEQKKKQVQTESEREAEIKIKEKGPIVVQEKPQTILVQVSKRKKIEYGPYINRQSLLEGKPVGKEADSPPKPFRPKPKPPQVPVRSTFNLRARKTKTDFASLASRGSKTPDTKKVEDKEKTKSVEKSTKTVDKTVPTDVVVSTDDKIRTRNKDKKEKTEKELDDSNPVIGENEKTEKSLDDSEKIEGRPKLRTRSGEKIVDLDNKSRTLDKVAKGEVSEIEGKSLRRRTVKTSSEGLKIKITKQDQNVKSDPETSADENSRTIALKNAQKSVPEKPDIKKCSVNLGENLSELKIKTVMRTSCMKDKEVSESVKSEGDELKESKDTDESEVKASREVTVLENKGVLVSGLANIHSGRARRGRGKYGAKHRGRRGSAVEVRPEGTNAGPDILDGVTEAKEAKDNVDGEVCLPIDSGKVSESCSDRMNIEVNAVNEIVKGKPDSCIDTEPKVEIPIKESVFEKVSIKIKLGGDFQRQYQEGLSNARKRKSMKAERRRESRHEKRAKVSENRTDKIEVENNEEEVKTGESLVPMSDPVFDILPGPGRKANESFTEETESSLPDCSPAAAVVETKTDLVEEKTEVKKLDDSRTNIKNPVSEVVEETLNNDILHEIDKDHTSQSEEKKVKHSVENEFQRLVVEAMAAVKNETDEAGKPARYSNLRKRMNESIRYNVDDSDDDQDLKMAYFSASMPPAKAPKFPVKADKKLTPKFSQKKTISSAPPKVKKDVDVYDFTDTEMSDKEEETPSKLSFKPKYVTNIKNFGSSQLPFVSKPVSPFAAPCDEPEEAFETIETEEESEYVGKTVEPLKIKLTKIIPYIEKKHKHKKKKRKKEKRRHNSRDESLETVDSADEKESTKSLDNETVASVEPDDVDKIVDTPEDSNSNECNDEESDSPQGRGVNRLKSKEKKVLEKKHTCVYCNQGFSQKCDLRKHIMIHTGERPYPCDICEKRFLRKTDLVKHTRTHTGEKPYACEFCDKRVSDKSQLNVHRRLHTGDRPYQCTKCGKGCITSSELTRHRAVHCSDNNHVCELCKKTFKIKECLGMHMKMHYRSRSRPFRCNKCAFGFDRSVELERHKCSALAGQNVYICCECSEEFTDEMLYGEHIQTHELDVFSCNMCTHIFEDKASLETHLCNLGVDKQPVQCDICKQEFSSPDALSQHSPVHDDDVGSFMCDLCPEMFGVRKYLLNHLKTHELTKAAAKPLRKPSAGSSCSSPPDAPQINRNSLEYPKQTTSQVLKVLNQFPSQETAPGQRNNARASVISSSFKSVDSIVSKDSGKPKGGGRYEGLSAVKSEPLVPLCQSTSVFSSGSGTLASSRSQANKFPESDKLFDTTEFSNSPDFSSLTDDGALSFDLYQKFTPGGRDISGQTRNFGRLSDMSPPSSGDAAVKRETEPDCMTTVTSAQINPSTSSNQAQSDFRWPYQVPAQDYMNTLLNKVGSDDPPSSSDFSSKLYNIKAEGRENVLPKSESMVTGANTTRLGTEVFKDNIENQSKSAMFLDFECALPSQKPDSFQSSKNVQPKFASPNSSESTAFQGLNQNSYNLTRNRQQYQSDKSDFSNYSQFLNTFHSNSLFTSGNSANLFGPNNHDKRGSNNSLFTEGSDPIHNNYFLSVEDPLKGTSPSDKTDETAALLSNFDYGMS